MTESGDPIFICGPTASGKSELALLLCEKINGEIISVDSMQVYIGLDIGTAKPNAEERARIPHHGVDLLNLSESYHAAEFVGLAHAKIMEIQKRQRTPVFCGGTGFYFSAFLKGMNQAPPSDPTLRRELEDLPSDELLQEIREKDPVTWSRIDRQNRRRLIRAVEVIRLSGKPFSGFQPLSGPTKFNDFDRTRMVWIERDQTDLRNRIRSRCDGMFARGLVEETREQIKHGLKENPAASNALGYKQVIAMLDHNLPLQATMERVKTKTWQFARRQRTWQRNQLQFPILSLDEESSPTKSLKRLIESLGLDRV